MEEFDPKLIVGEVVGVQRVCDGLATGWFDDLNLLGNDSIGDTSSGIVGGPIPIPGLGSERGKEIKIETRLYGWEYIINLRQSDLLGRRSVLFSITAKASCKSKSSLDDLLFH